MLHEICADLTVVKALAQAAESKVDVGKYRSISLLNDELIKEGEAARKGVEVSGPLQKEQVRKRGSPPLLRERGQAPFLTCSVLGRPHIQITECRKYL